MTPEQALSVLDQASSQAAGTRAQHVEIQSAVMTLRQVLDAPTEGVIEEVKAKSKS